MSTSTSTSQSSINPLSINSVQLQSQSQPQSSIQSTLPITETPDLNDPNPDLFWLPARLHPEIAPQEFKAFIQEATKPENLLRRTNSALGSRRRIQTEDDPTYPTANSALGRKKSMLSKVYDPSSDSDPSTSNHRSSLNPETSSSNQINRGQSMSSRGGLGRGLEGLESLTINDLQRLESLVLNNDPTLNPSTPLVDSSEGNVAGFGLGQSRITAVLRRSLSMGGAAALYSGNESSDDSCGDPTDDSPLISRAPGHIIRRTARTKVRKTTLAGDGNGHRFPATRRTKIVNPSSLNDQQSTPSTSLDSFVSEDSVGASTVQPDQHLYPQTDEEKRVSNISSSTDERSLEDGSLDESHSSHLHRSLSPGSKHTTTTSPTSICDSLTASSHDSKSNLYPLSTYPSIREPNSSPTEDYLGSTSLNPSARPISTASNSSLLDAYAELSSPEDSLPTITTESIETVPVPISRASYPPLSTINSTSTSSQNVSTHASSPYTSMSSSDHLPIGIPPNSQPPARTSVPFPTSSSTAPPHQSNNEIPNLAASLTVPGITDAKGKKTMTNPLTKSMDDLHTKRATSQDNTTRADHPTSSSSRPPNKQTKTSPPTLVSSTTSPPPSVKETKEKKRAWAKLGLSSSSSSDKSKKGKSKEKSVGSSSSSNNNASTTGSGKPTSKKEEGKKEASGSGSFLSGLFGGTKTKKTESSQSTSSSSSNHVNNSNNPTKPMITPTQKVEEEIKELNPTASGGFIKGRYTSFYRLPIHVERAVYRLSHIKLANPRRPLYEQVLISNLMFWYLGVINKTNVINSNQQQQQQQLQHHHQQQQSQQQQQQQQSGSGSLTSGGSVGQGKNGNMKAKNGKLNGIGEEGFEDETDSSEEEDESSSEESESDSSSIEDEEEEDGGGEEEEEESSSEGFGSCEGATGGEGRSGNSVRKKKKKGLKAGNQVMRNEGSKVKRTPGGVSSGGASSSLLHGNQNEDLKKKGSRGWITTGSNSGSNGRSGSGSGGSGGSGNNGNGNGNGKGKSKKS